MVPFKHMVEAPLLIALILAGIIVASISTARVNGYLQIPELITHDIFLVLTSSVNKEVPSVILVSVTEKEIQSLGNWPLTDLQLAESIKKIQSFQPRVIGIDIYRDHAIPPGVEMLNTLISETDNLIFIHKLGGDGIYEIRPPSSLIGTDQIGFSDMVVDTGGVVRRGLLFSDDGYQTYSSFSMALISKYLRADGIYPQPDDLDPTHIRLGNVTISPFEKNDGPYVNADAAGYQFLLNYRGGWLPFNQLSLSDLDSKKIGDSLRDKIIIMGVTADSVKDSFVTPFSRTGNDKHSMSGIALHGYVTDQLLRIALKNEQPLKVTSETEEYFLITLCGLFGAIIAVYIRSLWKFMLVLLVGMLIAVYVTYIEYLAGLWLPLFPMLMSLGLAAGTVQAFFRDVDND